MKIGILLVFAAAVLLLAFLFTSKKADSVPALLSSVATPAPRSSITIGTTTLEVEVADTPAKMKLGLGERDGLIENEGMLFPYSSKTPAAFWMKDMRFSLDIIWLADGKVVDIHTDVLPEPEVSDSNLKLYTPKEPVDNVLEVSAGFVEKNKIKVGDSFSFQTQSYP